MMKQGSRKCNLMQRGVSSLTNRVGRHRSDETMNKTGISVYQQHRACDASDLKSKMWASTLKEDLEFKYFGSMFVAKRSRHQSDQGQDSFCLFRTLSTNILPLVAA